ncbi:MAG: hypothetical protein WD379_06835 [Dehalococcoidia bacterium]
MRTAILTFAVALLGAAMVSACDGSSSDPVAEVTELCEPLARAGSFTYTIDYALDTPMLEGEVDPDVDIGDYALQPGSPDFSLSQKLDGTYQRPDKLDVIVATEGGGELHLIFVGQERWAFLNDRWTPSQQPVPFPILDVCDGALTGVELEGVTPEEESVNGEDTLRYELKGLKLKTTADLWGPNSDMGRVLDTFDVTLWLTEDGEVPVRIESRADAAYPSGRQFTMDLTVDIRDLNGDISVEPPS